MKKLKGVASYDPDPANPDHKGSHYNFSEEFDLRLSSTEISDMAYALMSFSGLDEVSEGLSERTRKLSLALADLVGLH